jgi:hypothetical protein
MENSDIITNAEVVEMGIVSIADLVKNEPTTPNPSELYTPMRNKKYNIYGRGYYFPFYVPGCH